MGEDTYVNSPLNSPVEVGVRVLMLLSEDAPNAHDLNHLVLLDYALVHSADLGGPPSLHPAVPIRSGELGVRRHLVEGGLEAMRRAQLVDSFTAREGILHAATDGAPSFVRILRSPHATALASRAEWCISEFGDQDTASIRETMRTVVGAWTAEIHDGESGSRS